MTVLGGLLLLAGAAVVIGGCLWYLLITTEGVYLGRRVVVGLYDLYARRYDNIKNFDRDWEGITLAAPFLEALQEVERPLILDAATGTARLPLTLFDQPDFQGAIIGLDFSRRMLRVATENVKKPPHAIPPDRLIFLHQTAESLPFPDDTFDAITCLEALEFMPNQHLVLTELVRVLRPGGLLLLTNRKGSGALMMPFKTQAADRLADRLRERYGLIDVRVEIWQVDYQQVWAYKPGELTPALPDQGPIPALESFIRCPACGKTAMVAASAQTLRCKSCETTIPIAADGVIEYSASVR